MLKENLAKYVGQYRVKIAVHQLFCEKVLNVKKGDIGVIVNGRVCLLFIVDTNVEGILTRLCAVCVYM